MSHRRPSSLVAPEPPALLGAYPALVPQPAPRMVTPEVTTALNATTAGNATPLVPTGAGGGVLEVISPLSLDGTAIPRGRMYAQAWVVDSMGNRLFTVWSGYLVTAGGTPAGPASVPGIPLDPSWSIIAVVTQTGQGAATRVGFAAFISPGGVARGSPGYIFSEAPGDGRGERRMVTVAAPGAGSEVVLTVGAKVLMSVLSCRATLTSDATVVNRLVRAVVDDGTDIYGADMPDYAQAASLGVNYWGAVGQTTLRSGGASSTVQQPFALSERTLPAAHRWRTNTTNLQAGDAWGTTYLVVEEWAIP